MKSKKGRKSGRINLPAALQASVDLRNQVNVINLSASGAMIEHVDRLCPGGICILFLPLPGVNLRLRAQLVWSQVIKIDRVSEGGGSIRFRSGLHFPNLTEVEAAHLRQYLADLVGQGTDPRRAPALAPDPVEDTSPAIPQPESENELPAWASFSRFR